MRVDDLRPPKASIGRAAQRVTGGAPGGKRFADHTEVSHCRKKEGLISLLVTQRAQSTIQSNAIVAIDKGHVMTCLNTASPRVPTHGGSSQLIWRVMRHRLHSA